MFLRIMLNWRTQGSEQPEKIIVVGGHLDSWDLGDGAHDDSAE